MPAEPAFGPYRRGPRRGSESSGFVIALPLVLLSAAGRSADRAADYYAKLLPARRFGAHLSEAATLLTIKQDVYCASRLPGNCPGVRHQPGPSRPGL
ncbi:MAG: hypothetical protein ABJD68_02650 [Nakamurella sp.]